MNVTELARSCGLSRATVLYYEAEGLLKPARRSASGYRVYGESELQRLQQIRGYRSAGLTLDDIARLLDGKSSSAGAVLQRRLQSIGVEIERLRDHQRAILALLKQKSQFRRKDVMTKDKWVGIMRSAGLSDADMERWHREFEKADAAEHQQFLEYLQISPEEIGRIREWSRS